MVVSLWNSCVSQPIGAGSINLSDGTLLPPKMLVVEIEKMRFSPFSGVNFHVNVTGGCREVHPKQSQISAKGFIKFGNLQG